jgi:hypothetical protein
MADGLEFTISAKDQASKAVETVQKKIKNLGSDLAKGFLSFAAPLALVQSAIGFVTEAIEAQKKKVQEAIEAYSGIGDKAADIGVNADEFLRLQQAADASGIAINKVGKLFKEVTGIIEQATVVGSEQERMLKALGFSAEQIASGLLKPTQVIEAMAKTLGSATSNTEQLSLATVMLGSNAADLIPVLLKAQSVISGYGEDPGITPEEVQLLEDKKKKEKQKANREAAAIAKAEAIAEAFKTNDDPEFKAIKQRAGARAAQGGTSADINLTPEQLANDAIASKEAFDLIKKRNEEKKRGAVIAGAASAAELHNLEMARLNAEAVKIAEAQMAEADAANNKDDAEALKKRRKDLGELLDAEAKANADTAKEAAKKAEKSNKLTVSSLREIGGAMAGEFTPGTSAPVIDYQKESLNVEQKILLELEKVNNIFNENKRPGVDFTKDPNQSTFIV